MSRELPLRYGMNPHQAPARVFLPEEAGGGDLPLSVRNGAPGFINLLDALNAWQLVREVAAATGLPAATSFKHTAPAGVGLGLPLPAALAAACRVAGGFATRLRLISHDGADIFQAHLFLAVHIEHQFFDLTPGDAAVGAQPRHRVF